MTPEDLFHTQELDEMRIKQRRLLRDVPDSYFSWWEIPKATGAEGFLEPYLRELAGGLHASVEKLWGSRSKSEAARWTLDLLDKLLSTGRPAPNLKSLKKAVKADSQKAPDSNEVDGDTVQFVFLAVWADDLAGDYQDPRLGERQAVTVL